MAFRLGSSAAHAAMAGGLPPHLHGNLAFEAAARHSRRVHRLRKAIPVCCAAVLALLAARGLIGQKGVLPDASLENSGIGIQGRKIVMEKPKLSGFKRDGRSYEVTATQAVQDLKSPNIVELQSLTARMQTGQDGWANITGAQGVYDSKSERMTIQGGLRIRTDGGLDATLQDAEIEFKAGAIVTEKPVDVKMQQGQVQSERLTVEENGKRLVFEGRVRSVFVNPGKAGSTADGKDASADAAEESETE